MDAAETKRVRCELCGAAAAVRCDSDAAFLCPLCDATVHGANFLVARHVRQLFCSVCHRLDRDRPFTGVGILLPRPICSSCEFDVDDSSSSSSSCISTAEKREAAIIARRPRRASREERALARLWCEGRVMRNPKASRIATNALRPKMRTRSRPFRICAAAASFAMKPHLLDSAAKFKRTEACSVLPLKQILAAESDEPRLSLALGGCDRNAKESSESSESSSEGWGESSSSSP